MDWNTLISQLIAQEVQKHLPGILQHVTSAIQGGGHNQQHAAPAHNYAPAPTNQPVQQFAQAQPMQTPNTNMGGQVDQYAGQQFGGQPQQPDAFGGGVGGAPVTAEMVQALITPMVQNEQQKAALTAEMQAMGIASLNDVRPDQLAPLYQRFIGVRDRFAQQGQMQQQQPQQQAVQPQQGGGII